MKRSYLMSITAMLIFGTIGIFRRYIPLSSGLLAFSRGILGGFYLFLFMLLTHRKRERVGKRNLVLLVITGALIGLNWIFLFESYNYTTVSVATMCYYMQPTIVILVSPLLLGERLTPKKLVCAALAVAGMFLISGMADGGGIGKSDMTGILYGLGAAALYASVIILNKKISVDDAYLRTMIQLFAASLTIVPYILLTVDISSVSLSPESILLVLVVGIVHTGIAYAMYFGSMKGLRAQSIAVISYIDPVFALILSALVLGETLTVFGITGAVLIIGSAILSETGRK